MNSSSRRSTTKKKHGNVYLRLILHLGSGRAIRCSSRACI